jgi:hypothetical protein
MKERLVTICGREFALGAVYAPRKPGPRKLPRQLVELKPSRDVIYRAGKLTRHCWCATWAAWAGEEIA